MNDPINNGLYDNPDLAQFYDFSNHARVDFDFCLGLAKGAKSVLDLGCGTGELGATLAQEHEVTGVDPAAAMLDIAAKRPDGDRATWVEADARTVRLGQRFDLVVLTGHAYQVFLTNDAQLEVLKTIAAHLNPDGRFIFDSRNPDFPLRKTRKKEGELRRFTHPEHGEIEMWNRSNYDKDIRILSYENGYKVIETGEMVSEKAQIYYTPKDELAGLIEQAGLRVEKWLGDWKGTPFAPDSREIIPLGGLV